MKHFTYHTIFLCLLFLLACKQKDQNTIPDSLAANPKVSLELSIPSTDAGKFLYLSCADNEVSLILRNNSDNPVRFYQLDNSLGYQNYSFIIKTKDTTYQVTKAVSLFWKNVPFYHTILPHESLVLNFNIKDTRCDLEFNSNGQLKRNIIRVTNGWQGLPEKPVEQATIQALYKLPAEHIGFKPFGAAIYSDSLLSNTLSISIDR